jgi:hypothetical protein
MIPGLPAGRRRSITPNATQKATMTSPETTSHVLRVRALTGRF